jgi:hypothetical protein
VTAIVTVRTAITVTIITFTPTTVIADGTAIPPVRGTGRRAVALRSARCGSARKRIGNIETI